jgi:hypothetical protein
MSMSWTRARNASRTSGRSQWPAALAGDNFIRERRIGETARHAEMAITRLAVAGRSRSLEAAPELPERTAAVVATYRELADGR